MLLFCAKVRKKEWTAKESGEDMTYFLLFKIVCRLFADNFKSPDAYFVFLCEIKIYCDFFCILLTFLYLCSVNSCKPE